jgi:hypothetical protein
MEPSETPPALPRSEKIRPLRVLIDIGITYGLSVLGGFVLGVASAMAGRPLAMGAIAVSNIVCSAAGFTIAGCYTTKHRWPHLLLVAGGLWLTGLANLRMGFSLTQWFLSIVVIAFAMGVGGGLATLIKRNEGKVW